jgi:hypothetical protein
MSQNLQDANGVTIAFTSGVLATSAGTAKSPKTTASVTYSVNGQFAAAFAALDPLVWVIEPGSGIVPTAPNSWQPLNPNSTVAESCGFSIFLDSAGALTIAQGPIVPGGQKVSFPAPPTGKVIIGGFKVAAAAGAIYTPNSTALTGLVTYYNFTSHPGQAL